MTDRPHRVQLRRTKGWRMPANTVKVARPAVWGNPYVVRSAMPHADVWDVWIGPVLKAHSCLTKAEAQAEAVRLFRKMLDVASHQYARDELRGKNLACWCEPGTPCHADMLLEIANS